MERYKEGLVAGYMRTADGRSKLLMSFIAPAEAAVDAWRRGTLTPEEAKATATYRLGWVRRVLEGCDGTEAYNRTLVVRLVTDLEKML